MLAARRTDLVVGDCTATIFENDGSADLLWHRGPPGEPWSGPLFNDFIKPGMGDQLRALADAVDAANERRGAR
ncbi:hypothetical protein [Paenirhodobacter populi]|nr:hypothetical protein [Sinirhodobacter populi]